MEGQFLTLDDVILAQKRVLIREDFNVAIKDGAVVNDWRIRAALPGIRQALNANAQVLLMSHLGRPTPGNWQMEYSLFPVAICLQNLLNMPVKFIRNWFREEITPQDKIVLFENVRFLVGETENDPTLAKKMASLCDVFVLDAFASAHRAHASTTGVIKYAPIAVAGPLVEQEVLALEQIMRNPKHPVVAIIGGAKVSTKLATLQSLLNMADTLLIGGGMANTFLAADGKPIGASLYEKDLVRDASDLLNLAHKCNCEILLPTDVVTQDGKRREIGMVPATDKIMDIGPNTIQKYTEKILAAATIFWNGPLGVFEDPAFAAGTQAIAKAVADSTGYSVVGGGDSVAAIDQFKLADRISYISTGGGAFLEYLEGKELPALKALINKR